MLGRALPVRPTLVLVLTLLAMGAQGKTKKPKRPPRQPVHQPTRTDHQNLRQPESEPSELPIQDIEPAEQVPDDPIVPLTAGDGGVEERLLPEDGVDHLPPTGRVYRPLRTEQPVKIDGVLDEEIWQRAPKDTRFLSRNSEPFGLPTTEPTTVQVAYDDTNLYVAFRCAYSGPGERDELVPDSELWASMYSEFVSVVVDPQHDHTNAISFLVTRTGFKVDVEVTENSDFDGWLWGGVAANYEWNGIWQARPRIDPTDDSWTAEYAIPWGTLRLVPREGAQGIGINFRRKSTSFDKEGKLIRESSTWSPWSPLDFRSRPSMLGHLAGLTDLRPGNRLYVAPSVTVRAQGKPFAASPLRDPIGAGWPVTAYPGLNLRLKPLPPLQVDLALNPDFSQVTPDQALTVLESFEQEYPEVREFFAEDQQRYAFGSDPRFRLFWTRRIGLSRPVAGTTQLDETPILAGTKAVLRLPGHEFRLLDVATTFGDRRSFELNENFGIWRHNSYLQMGEVPIHVGTLFLNKSITGQPSAYRAYGADGTVALIDNHLVVSGFFARSDTAGAASGSFWSAGGRWNGEFLTLGANLVSVDPTFDAQMGLFQQVGVRQGEFQVIVRPRVHEDLIRDVYARFALLRRLDFEGRLALDQKSFEVNAVLLDQANMTLQLDQEQIALNADTPFAGGRIVVPPGSYDSLVAHANFTGSPEGRLPEWQVSYTEGGFFGGYRRTIGPAFGVRAGPLNLRAAYDFIDVRFGGQQLYEHRVSARVLVRPLPSFQTALVVEANTFERVARLQLVSTYTFGEGSSLSLALNDVGATPGEWIRRSSMSGSLKFTYGFFAF
jgi:hypothetical protein